MKAQINYFKWICQIAVFLLLIALDQWTKQIAKHSLLNKPYIIRKHVFSLVYTENRGAAWGILENSMVFFILITVVVLLLFLVFFVRIEKILHTQKKHIVLTAKKFQILQNTILLLASGAVGNLIDRILRGYVIDFIYLEWIDFPVFNLADCYVTISAGILLIFFLFIINTEEYEMLFPSEKKKEQVSKNE